MANDRDITQTSRAPYAKRTALTTAAVAIGDSTATLTELMIQADPDNTTNVLLGDATAQVWVLQPGQEIVWPVRNPALIFGKMASSTGNVNLIGRYGE